MVMYVLKNSTKIVVML